MKVIGHRGAAGLAPENSLAAIRAAIKTGVDGVEFDIRITADQAIVLSHDDSLLRTFGSDRSIAKSKLSQLKKLKNPAGESIATLDQALKVASGIEVFIEGKASGWAKPLAQALKKISDTKKIKVISFNHQELSEFGKLNSGTKLYALTFHNPWGAIKTAQQYGFDGVDIHFLLLNPLIYRLAKRHKLDLVIYTINRPKLAKFIAKFYPDIAITTDVPQKMQFRR